MKQTKKKQTYLTPETESIMIQMEQCIASPTTIPDMGGNGVYDEDF